MFSKSNQEIMMNLDKNELALLTEKYGGTWGINHTRRLLHLISIIGKGQQYDSEAVWLAAHLHDWGAYPPWAQLDVDHALRSTQVAETFLAERECPQQLKSLVLDCIAHHHSGGPDRGMEATLLFDADALDFLGVVGVLRDFSKNPKDMRKAFKITGQRRAKLPGMLVLDKSKEIAAERVRQMDELLARFEHDSWGCF
jgi:HD superfamily phosphodiesterase